MAEVTYYCDGYFTGEAWTSNPSSMTDGILTNYASENIDGTLHRLTSNTCDGTDLGTITKVEARAYGYGDGNDRVDLWVIGNFMGDEHQLTLPSSPGWSSYTDITNDTNAPDPWTWLKVGWLGFKVEYDKVGKGNTMYCAKVEIRVTYTPSGPEPEKVTQYLTGNDCPVFPHGMDFQSDKLPCPPPYD